MKSNKLTLVAVLLLLIGYFGYRYYKPRVGFAGFPGLYVCKEFGMPNKDYSTLRVGEDLALYGLKGDAEVRIGRLVPVDNSHSRSRVEFSNEIVHNALFNLDPFADHVAEGIGNSLIFTASRDQKVLFSEPCYRK